MEPHVQRLRGARCTHGAKRHDEVAHGRDEHGAARAAAAAAYPRGMNEALADALLAGAASAHTAQLALATTA
eukprot:4304538-Pleurochrysis_carterae.AAC.1